MFELFSMIAEDYFFFGQTTIFIIEGNLKNITNLAKKKFDVDSYETSLE